MMRAHYERQIYDVNDETERALHSYWVEEALKLVI